VKGAIFNFRPAVITVALDLIDPDFQIASDASAVKLGAYPHQLSGIRLFSPLLNLAESGYLL
jgi:hypothetical protein